MCSPPHPGGAAISWNQLLSGFAKKGHIIRTVSPITAEALRGGDSLAVSNPEIEVVRYLVPYFNTIVYEPAPDEYVRLEDEKIKQTLSDLIADKRPDFIIIGRESFAPYVPDIAREHSLPCIMGIRGNTTIAILNKTYPEAQAQQLLKQYRKVNLLVSVAEHMAEGLKGLGFKSIKVITNAIDLDQFSPKPRDTTLLRKLAIRPGKIIVVHVSNLKTVKRPLDIVKSAEQALRQNPELLYVIVGDGQLRATMEEACKSKNISEKFRFLGWIDYNKMPYYINLADIVVMPSESEGLARAYLETQACARLLLASDIPPAREVIENGETGLLFRMGDIGDLTAKTLLAANDPKLCAEIGHKAREQVKTHDLKSAVAEYVTTIEEVIKQHRV